MMKTLFIISLFSIFCSSLYADQLAKISSGFFSPHGLIGVSYEKNISLEGRYSYAPTIGAGIDHTGFLTTVGARGFVKNYVDSSKWYNRCFFFLFKNCEHFYNVSGYLHHSSGRHAEITKIDKNSEFTFDNGWLSSFSIGSRSFINKKWIFDFEISQRVLLAGLEVKQKSGALDESERRTMESRRTALGISIGLGFVW